MRLYYSLLWVIYFILLVAEKMWIQGGMVSSLTLLSIIKRIRNSKWYICNEL